MALRKSGYKATHLAKVLERVLVLGLRAFHFDLSIALSHRQSWPSPTRPVSFRAAPSARGKIPPMVDQSKPSPTVIPVSCPHCKQMQVIHVVAPAGRAAAGGQAMNSVV